MMKIACIQLWHNDADSKQERIGHAEQLIDSASEADLILLPELWNIGWWSFDNYTEGREAVQGETMSRMAEKARYVNAYILAGSIVEAREKAFYNTAVLLNPKGQIAGTYSKMHLIGWQGAREKELLKRGEEVVTIKTEIGKLGLSICYDLRLPELFREMALVQGAEIILNVSAWPIVRQDNWRALCHVRAVENQCFLVACNMAGVNCGHQFLGDSTVMDPAGTAVASAGTQERVLKTEIDIQEIYRLRKAMPVLEDRFLSK